MLWDDIPGDEREKVRWFAGQISMLRKSRCLRSSTNFY
jgi:hypothetical protein